MQNEINKKILNEKEKLTIQSTSDGKYKTLFESINAAAFIANLKGKIIEANLKSCDLFGYSLDEYNNLDIKSIFSKDVDWKQILEEIISKGGMNIEAKTMRKNGTKFPVKIDTSLFTIDKEPLLLILIWNITDQKLREVQLRESEERYRCIFDNSAVAIMLINDRERIVSWNKYTENLLNMGEDELLNKPVAMLYPPDEWKKIRDERVREKGKQHHLETKMFKKDHSLINVDISISVIKNKDGTVYSSIGVIKDITEHNVDIFAIGNDWEGKFDFLKDYCEVVYLDRTDGISSTQLKQTLKSFSVSKEEMIKAFEILEQLRKDFE